MLKFFAHYLGLLLIAILTYDMLYLAHFREVVMV